MTARPDPGADAAVKTPVRFRIRDARPDEWEEVLRLTVESYKQYRTAIPPAGWGGYVQNMRETILEDSVAGRIVAEEDSRIVGSVLLYRGETSRVGEPMVRLLAVPPDQRGRGIGAALMRECIRRAREDGSKTLVLHTTAVMDVARGMYERMGFARAPELDFIPEDGGHESETDGERRVVMGYRLDLDAAEEP